MKGRGVISKEELLDILVLLKGNGGDSADEEDLEETKALVKLLRRLDKEQRGQKKGK